MGLKSWALFAALVAAAALVVFRPWVQTPQPWVPVLEQTGFAHLDDAVAAAAGAVREADGALARGEPKAAGASLRRAEVALDKLQRYFLPMTEVRQLIYDADRLYFLSEFDPARGKLRQARQRLLEVAAAGGPGLREALDELIGMLDELLLAIDNQPEAVAGHFRAVGEKVNLMVLKGDLELAGSTFER